VRSPLAGRNKPLDQSTRQRFAAPPEHPHRLLIGIEDETLGIHNQRGVRRSLEHRPVVVVVGKQAAPLAVRAAHGTKSRERQNNRRVRRAHVGRWPIRRSPANLEPERQAAQGSRVGLRGFSRHGFEGDSRHGLRGFPSMKGRPALPRFRVGLGPRRDADL